MSLLDNARELLNNLNARVENGDIEGGKGALSEMKVRQRFAFLNSKMHMK
jgi:hypothetical protein